MKQNGNRFLYDLIVIGGGAAGFFAAANYACRNAGSKVLILEKSGKVLSKVKVSGGGRCNVTNACFDVRELVKNYPRGEKEMMGPLTRFGPEDTMVWFESRGVKLKIEEDNRVFPLSNDSSDIINCLLREVDKYKVEVKLNTQLKIVSKEENIFNLECVEGELYYCKNLLVACGGSANEQAYDWLKKLGHSIVKPVPSLFTFNLPVEKITKLMGVSCKDVEVLIEGTRLKIRGPLLITHWGFSGPAVLKLSAIAARLLFEKKYEYTVDIRWTPGEDQESLKEKFLAEKNKNPGKTIVARPLFDVPKRLWEHLLSKAGIPESIIWGEITSKQVSAFTEVLLRDRYQAHGKTTYKEEFVTSGGVDTKEVNFKTMESKCCPGLFFAGEVINIDGVTGGFNFQNAWTGAWIAAESMNKIF